MTYRVFLSSTSRDLAEFREAVHRAIEGPPGFQLVRMEDFGGRGDAESFSGREALVDPALERLCRAPCRARGR